MSRLPTHRSLRAAFDLACIFFALGAAGAWSGHEGESALQTVAEVAGLWGMFSTIWILISSRLGTYQVSPSRNIGASIRRGIEAWAATWGLAGLVSISTFSHPQFSIWIVLVVGLVGLCLVRLVYAAATSQHAAERSRAVVIGAPKAQKNRQLKLECDTCGWTCRASQKMIDKVEHLCCPDYECGGQLEKKA